MECCFCIANDYFMGASFIVNLVLFSSQLTISWTSLHSLCSACYYTNTGSEHVTLVHPCQEPLPIKAFIALGTDFQCINLINFWTVMSRKVWIGSTDAISNISALTYKNEKPWSSQAALLHTTICKHCHLALLSYHFNEFQSRIFFQDLSNRFILQHCPSVLQGTLHSVLYCLKVWFLFSQFLFHENLVLFNRAVIFK